MCVWFCLCLTLCVWFQGEFGDPIWSARIWSKSEYYYDYEKILKRDIPLFFSFFFSSIKKKTKKRRDNTPKEPEGKETERNRKKEKKEREERGDLSSVLVPPGWRTRLLLVLVLSLFIILSSSLSDRSIFSFYRQTDRQETGDRRQRETDKADRVRETERKRDREKRDREGVVR